MHSTLLALGVMGPEQPNCSKLSLKQTALGGAAEVCTGLGVVSRENLSHLSKDPRFIPATT